MPDSISDTNTQDSVSKLIKEGLIGLTQAAKIFGTFRLGKTTRSGTVARWALNGIRLPGGQILKLESLRLNGRLCTTEQAVYRFIQAQNNTPTTSSAVFPTPAERTRAAASAAKQLDDLGIK